MSKIHGKKPLPIIEEEVEQSLEPSRSASRKSSADSSSRPSYVIFYTPKGREGLFGGFTTDKTL